MEFQTPSAKENKVKHLCSVASTLTSSPLSTVLKSYYLTKCRMLTLSGTVSLPQRFSKSTARCSRCCVEYHDGPVAFKIQPHKKNKFVKKLLKRHENGHSLTRYQDTYLKHLLRNGDVDTHNTLVITCGVCKRVTKEKLKKPQELNNEQIPEVRKKKKKKDRFSGLDKTAVLSATPQNKSYKTNNFMPLDTPHKNSVKKDIGHKKNLFRKNQKNNDKRNSEITNKKRKEIKEQQKQSKGLSKILTNSKPSKSPSTALKLFLTSI